MKLKKKYLVLGSLYFASISTFAAEELENIIVTGTHMQVAVKDLSSSVSILDNDFLRATNKRNVLDVLRTVPGLLVEELGGPGGLTAISVRGGESNFTLVLVDGVQLNDPTNTRGGSFDFSNIDMSSIERIEIVRGPQSALYGSDALAGVINIITRRSSEAHRQRATAEWGEDGYRHIAAGATGSFGDLGYSVQLSKRDSGEPIEGSERDNEEAMVGLDWSPSEGHELQINYRYVDGERSTFPEQSGGPEFAMIRDLDQNSYTDETLVASWAWRVLPYWHSALTASRFDHDEQYTSPGISPFFAVPPQLDDTRFTRDLLRWVNSFELGDNYRFSAGADYRDEEGESQGVLDFGGFLLPTDFTLDRTTKGLFLDGRTRVFESLLVQASVRYDDPDGFKSETTLNVGAKFDITQQFAVSANWGEAFKIPSFFALGHALVGNPDLKPETAESWDLGFHWTASENYALHLTYFSNEYEDLIDFDSQLFTNVNRNRVDSEGAELEFSWNSAEALNIRGHATYTDIEVKGEAGPLLGRPEWTAGATALWQLSSNWHTALDYQWVGEQYASSRHTGDTVIETLDDYHRFDVNLAWQVVEWASLELAVDNLFDQDYQAAVGFPGPGRSVRVSVTLSNIR